jgi:hypothetical protein
MSQTVSPRKKENAEAENQYQAAWWWVLLRIAVTSITTVEINPTTDSASP